MLHSNSLFLYTRIVYLFFVRLKINNLLRSSYVILMDFESTYADEDNRCFYQCVGKESSKSCATNPMKKKSCQKCLPLE